MNVFSQIALEYFEQTSSRWRDEAHNMLDSGETTEVFSPAESAQVHLAQALEEDLRGQLSDCPGVPGELAKAAINSIEFPDIAMYYLS